MVDEELGREHALACWSDPIRFAEKGPRTEAYVGAALAELERVQSESPGMIAALLDGGNQIARQLNADAFQGFREVVQNADDLGASVVRVGVRTDRGRRRLLIVHDGEPVELMHVLPMIYPSISTKRHKATAKGRFGVGLKTLSRLGSSLAVHSAPYHFTARENFAVRTRPVKEIEGFYNPHRDTLVTLDLDDEVDSDFLQQAFRSWTAAELIFLDTVRTVTVENLDERQILSRFALEVKGRENTFPVKQQTTTATVVERRFQVEGRRWVRYAVEVPVPAGQQRAHKATDATTRVALALPFDGDAQGRVYVALPTRIQTGTAFSLDAQFNPATSREELSSDKWNRWLVKASTEFVGALAIDLARRGSPLTWFLAPVGAATNSTSEWVNEHFQAGWEAALKAFQSAPELIGPQPGLGLDQVSYGDPATDGLLDEADHQTVGGAPMLPERLRDPQGRWRVVLDALGVSKRISLGDVLRACDAHFHNKLPVWFAELAQRCLEDVSGPDLLEGMWTPLADGSRAKPRERDEAAELLVLESSDYALAARHGLCLQVHPVLREERFSEVISWLTEDANLVSRATAEDVLKAFAIRYTDEPLEVSREEFVELRNLFADAPAKGLEDLGAAVGQALLIEAYAFQREAGVVRTRARPGELYLPKAIEDEPYGWSRAAGETPELLWASQVYEDVLKVAGRRGALTAEARRLRAAKRFLLLLGAHTVPRLDQVDTPIEADLPPLQWPARREIRKVEGLLRDDYVSRDLDRVLAEITTAPARRGRGRRRKGSPEVDRRVLLFRCLTANWSRLEGRTRTYAVRASGYGGILKTVPATWIARLAELPWLLNGLGEPTRPTGLAIATRITTAVETDPAKFAAGLDAQDATAMLARELHMRVDPTASELVAAIEQRREAGREVDPVELLRLYRALSALCPSGSGTPSPEARVGDLTVSRLRAKFGISRTRAGLIAGALTTRGAGAWYAPTAVYAGKDIFHGRLPFVVVERELAALWNALNIKPPDVGACVRELQEIAREAARPDREATLIDIYRHLDHFLDRPSSEHRRLLSKLPLLVAEGWTLSRPVYLSEHRGAAVAHLRIWSPPCSPSSIRNFVEAAGIEPLLVDDTPLSDVFGVSDDLQARIERALAILQADLARDDERSYRALEPWTRLLSLTVQLHATDGLVVQARPRGERPLPIMVRAHADLTNGALHVDSAEVIGRAEYGGAAIARFAGPDRRREIALAWASAWAASAEEAPAISIQLAGEASREIDDLEAQLERLGASSGKRRMKGGRAVGSKAGAVPRVEVRQLKELPPEVEFTVTLRDAAADALRGLQQTPKAALRSRPKARQDQPPSEQRPAPATAFRQYDARELQERGWAYILTAVEDGMIEVTDLQSERGVGADGTIGWKTFIETKSFGREAPAAVSLTAKEFQRARDAKGKFHLVIVCGLEKGFDTELHVYSDPLNTLPWTLQGSVTVSSLGAGRARILKVMGDPSPAAAS